MTGPLAAGWVLAGLVLAGASGAGAQARADSAERGGGHPLTLGDAVRLAARQSGPVLAARFETDQAAARVRQRRAELLPSVSALAQGGGRTFNVATFGFEFPTTPGQPPIFDPAGQVLGPVRTVDLRAQATVPIYDPVARRRVKSARSSVDASDASADAAAETAALTAATYYLRALRASALLEARYADSVLADSLVGIAKLQLQAGVAVGLDVTRSESQLATVRAQLISARAERDKVRLELLRALALPLDTVLVLADSLGVEDVLRPVDQATATTRALSRRPELRELAASFRAAELSAAAQRAERLPRFEAFGDYGASGKVSNRILGTYDWGFRLAVPIFNGFGREGRIAEALARSRELVERRKDVEAQVALEVRTVELDLFAAREQVDAARERRRLAVQELTQARERFQAGVAGNADVITALLGLNQARTLEVEALTAFRSAVVGRAKAQGDLLELK